MNQYHVTTKSPDTDSRFHYVVTAESRDEVQGILERRGWLPDGEEVLYIHDMFPPVKYICLETRF